jgi:hypothetical protein
MSVSCPVLVPPYLSSIFSVPHALQYPEVMVLLDTDLLQMDVEFYTFFQVVIPL